MSDAASQEVLNPGFVLAPNQPLAVSREAFIRHRQMFFDILRYAEQVSQVFCAADICAAVEADALRVLAVTDRNGRWGFCITGYMRNSRGIICTAWVLPEIGLDDAALGRMLAMCEAAAVEAGCAVFEIKAPPAFAGRIEGPLMSVTIERDLRLPPQEARH